jgi:hypothetical protein
VANVVGIPEEEALSENGLQKCLHEWQTRNLCIKSVGRYFQL